MEKISTTTTITHTHILKYSSKQFIPIYVNLCACMYANRIGMSATLISSKLYLICFNLLLHANHGNLYQNYLLLQWQAIYKHLANAFVLSVVPYAQMHADFIACQAINNSLHKTMRPKSKKCIHKRTHTHALALSSLPAPIGRFSYNYNMAMFPVSCTNATAVALYCSSS